MLPEALPHQEVLHGPHQLDDLDGETVGPAVCLREVLAESRTLRLYLSPVAVVSLAE